MRGLIDQILLLTTKKLYSWSGIYARLLNVFFTLKNLASNYLTYSERYHVPCASIPELADFLLFYSFIIFYLLR